MILLRPRDRNDHTIRTAAPLPVAAVCCSFVAPLWHASPYAARCAYQAVKHCNFNKTKAKNVKNCAKALCERYNGVVPTQYDQLVALPGVGPKIAHLMRSVAFAKEDAGIVVDTHVHRIARKSWFAS